MGKLKSVALLLSLWNGISFGAEFCCQNIFTWELRSTVTSCTDIKVDSSDLASTQCARIYPRSLTNRPWYEEGRCGTRCDAPDPLQVPASSIPVEGSIYGLEDDSLFRIDPMFGRFGLLSKSWRDLQAASFYNGSIYVMQNKYLHRVDPATGAYTVLGKQIYTTVDHPSFLGVIKGRLYGIYGTTFRIFNTDDGSNTPIGEYRIWRGATSFTTSDSFAYVIQNNHLHEINPDNGSWRVLGGPDWNGPTVMKYFNGNLYIIQNGTLHSVSPVTGSWAVLGRAGDWAGTSSMTAMDGYLYVVQNSTLHKVNPSNGAWTIVGQQGTWFHSTYVIAP